MQTMLWDLLILTCRDFQVLRQCGQTRSTMGIMLELCEYPSLIPYVFLFYLIFPLDCCLDQIYIIKFVFQVKVFIDMSQLTY